VLCCQLVDHGMAGAGRPVMALLQIVEVIHLIHAYFSPMNGSSQYYTLYIYSNYRPGDDSLKIKQIYECNLEVLYEILLSMG
jgi:hypothetical protein